MPTDFSFVTQEGWEAMLSDFEAAEKKIRQKVEKKEMAPDVADRSVRLMWEKYDRWSSGRGKGKENQTMMQQDKKGKTASMERAARIGLLQYVTILNRIADGTIQNPAVFLDTLRVNHIEPEEFFSYFASDVAKRSSIYQRNYVSYMSDLFSEWGYDQEVAKVVDSYKAATAPKPEMPQSLQRPAPAIEQAPAPQDAPAAAQPAAPAPDAEKLTVTDLEPKKPQYPSEPRPWPSGMEPKRSTEGQTYRWYVQYQLPSESEVKASVADGVSRDDILKHVYKLQRLGVKFLQIKPVSEVGEVSLAQAPRATRQPPAAAEAPAEQPQEKEEGGTIEQPDPKDPNKYMWLVRYKTKGGKSVEMPPPNMTGTEAVELMKWFERSGMKIIEMRKLAPGPLTASASERSAQNEQGYDDRFKAGTPIIFTDDVNLEFEAISARGEIKKNMTGKVKKVEEQNYVIDIAGQLYRVPKIVAEAVMEEFMPSVVVHDKDIEQGHHQKPKPQPQVQRAPVETGPQQPAQLPQAQAPASPTSPSMDLSRAPRPRGAASDDGRIVVADGEIEAFAMTKAAVSLVFERQAGADGFVPADGIAAFAASFSLEASEPGKTTMQDLHETIKERTKEQFKLDKKEDKLQHKMEKKQEASAKSGSQMFADLLALIEREAPGVPSEIGRRLWRTEGIVRPQSH